MQTTEPAASGYEQPEQNLLKRQVILTLDQSDGENLKVGIEFDPPMIMPENADFEKMTDPEKGLQNYAAHVANLVMDALQNTAEAKANDTAE